MWSGSLFEKQYQANLQRLQNRSVWCTSLKKCALHCSLVTQCDVSHKNMETFCAQESMLIPVLVSTCLSGCFFIPLSHADTIWLSTSESLYCSHYMTFINCDPLFCGCCGVYLQRSLMKHTWSIFLTKMNTRAADHVTLSRVTICGCFLHCLCTETGSKMIMYRKDDSWKDAGKFLYYVNYEFSFHFHNHHLGKKIKLMYLVLPCPSVQTAAWSNCVQKFLSHTLSVIHCCSCNLS